MNTYTLEFGSRVEKLFAGLPAELQRRLLERIQALAENPFAPGTKKLEGRDGYRVRDSDYRIVFDVDTRARVVTVLAVDHRSNVYRRL